MFSLNFFVRLINQVTESFPYPIGPAEMPIADRCGVRGRSQLSNSITALISISRGGGMHAKLLEVFIRNAFTKRYSYGRGPADASGLLDVAC